MASNYSDSPSMDEILGRIKRALSERESLAAGEGSKIEQVREFARNPDVTDRIVSQLAGDEIFLGPSEEKREEVRIKPTARHSEAPVRPRDAGVFVLTKKMELPKKIDWSRVDFDEFCSNLAVKLCRDLAIPYLSPKTESWLRENLITIIRMSQKK